MKKDQVKRDDRVMRARQLILPTEPNQYGRTALVVTDIDSKFAKAVAPYSTLGNQNYFWRSITDTVPLVQLNTADGSVAINFALQNFPGYADFAGCFDQYRLKAVAVKIQPSNNIEASGGSVPRLYTCIDYDDASTITRNQILQYDTCVESPPGTGVVRAFVPRMALAAYSGTFTSYANVEPQWLDIASTGVQHYGLKLIVEQGNGTQSQLQAYSGNIEAYWEFRAAR